MKQAIISDGKVINIIEISGDTAIGAASSDRAVYVRLRAISGGNRG